MRGPVGSGSGRSWFWGLQSRHADRASRKVLTPPYLSLTLAKFAPMDDPFLAVAWEDVHAANEALGWFVGQPAYEPHRIVPWSMYAFDPQERPIVGDKSRECTAIGETGLDCVLAMARCLREISEGRVPE